MARKDVNDMHYRLHRQVPKSMPKGEREMLLSELEELRRVATMESANFGSDETTESIKRQTDLWRNSWLIAPLERLIKRYETGEGYNPYT